MKNIIRFTSILLMTLLSSVFTAQLSPADLALPENLYYQTFNVVFHSEFEQCSKRAPGHSPIEMTNYTVTSTVNGVTTKSTQKVIRESRYRSPGIRPNVGVYGLNLVCWYVHDYGYSNITTTDSGFVFSNNNGQAYAIWQKNNTWYAAAQKSDYGFRLTDPVTKISRYYSEAELLQMKFVARNTTKLLPITKSMLVEWSQNYRIGEVRNPATHVCNVFTTISRTDANTYRGNIYVNGIDVANINESALITSFGSTGMTFTPRWRYLNGCAAGDGGSSPGYEYGSAGQCYQAQGTVGNFQNTTVEPSDHFSYNADLVLYDVDKPFLLWFQAESFQAQGKNESDESFYNVTENRPQQTLNR